MTGRTGITSALVAIIALALWLACGRSAVKETVYPVENGRTWFSRSFVPRIRGLFNASKAAAENEKLKTENESLLMLRADVTRLREENENLRALLELGSRRKTFAGQGWVCAPVLSRGGAAGVSGILRVGRGLADGITTNAPVAVPSGLVGRVESVTMRTADVRLITDPSVKISCEIETPDASFAPVRGILTGGGTHSVNSDASASILYVIEPLRIRHLKRQPRLSARARVFTSGLGGIYPRGLTVGFLIDEQDVNENVLEREGDVIAAVDIPSLENVFIRREN